MLFTGFTLLNMYQNVISVDRSGFVRLDCKSCCTHVPHDNNLVIQIGANLPRYFSAATYSFYSKKYLKHLP